MDRSNMNDNELTGAMLALVPVAASYCETVERAPEQTRRQLVSALVRLLPDIYLKMAAVSPDDIVSLGDEYFAEYVDEDLYESVRHGVAAVMGEQDVYLETHEEDMKYSDTPIAVTISEGLADIFQALYNYVGIVKDSDGEMLQPAFRELREKFDEYWSQTLCNVMRPLNSVWHDGDEE